MKPDRTRTWDATPEAAAYRQQYRDTHYDRVELNLPAGMKSEIDAAVREEGISRNAWIISAIRDRLEKRTE